MSDKKREPYIIESIITEVAGRRSEQVRKSYGTDIEVSRYDHGSTTICRLEAARAKDAELIQRFVDHNAKWVGNGCLEADREWDDIVSDCIAAGFRPTV